MDDLNKNEEVNEIENSEEVFEVINDDSLSTEMTEDDVLELTEDEASIVAQKIEVEIEKYEDILIKAENEFLSNEEVIALGFDQDDYLRLKSLEKKVYAHIHRMHKQEKGKGFFSVLPWWSAVICIICALFTIVPINPYLPLLLQSGVSDSFTSDFLTGKGGVYLFYFLYIGIFFIVEFVSLLLLYLKSKKNVEKKAAFKSFLIIVIINLVLAAPGIFIFLRSAISTFA